MLKRLLTVAALLVVAALVAVGFAVYVYPVYPALVWCLLFLCWACYRLRLRALAMFGPPPTVVPPVDPQ